MADGLKDVPLEQVEWRVDSEPYERNGRTSCRWVPYLNAPIVARLLDEWVGPDGWSDSYDSGTLAGKEVLWCHLDIGGVVKSDVGVPSNTEAQKGMVSDAFKRAACLKWGVGRNVYDLPTLWAVCGSRNGKNDKKIATETPETLPDILRQLKTRGFDAEGGRVRDEPEESELAGAPANVDVRTGELAPVSDLDAMRPRELNAALRDRGLDASGTEAEMRERLRAALAEHPATQAPEPHGYDHWSREELSERCSALDLPHSGNKERLIGELRAYDASNGITVEYDEPQF